VFAVFYGLSCVVQLWSAVYMHAWVRLAWLPLYIAMAIGLWTMKRWGLYLVLGFNALVGVLSRSSRSGNSADDLEDDRLEGFFLRCPSFPAAHPRHARGRFRLPSI
jgi:hypothetical protein